MPRAIAIGIIAKAINPKNRPMLPAQTAARLIGAGIDLPPNATSSPNRNAAIVMAEAIVTIPPTATATICCPVVTLTSSLPVVTS
jgi:hypothetical protein